MNRMGSEVNTDYCPNCFCKIIGHSAVCPKCGYDASECDRSPNCLPACCILKGRYMLGRTLGVGGFGITYLAKDLENNSEVAIKEYFPCELAMRNGDMSLIPTRHKEAYIKGMERFYEEAAKLAALYDCPTVVKIWDFFRENNTAYIVMEYLDGMTMKHLMRENGGKLDYDTAWRIIVDIAKGLADVHAHNMLHRDISPENIMITSNGSVRLIDFGASREYVKNQSEGFGLTVILKPGYAPPEQYSRKKKQGKYSDIYSLAATFYRSVTGKSVPDAQSRITGTIFEELKELAPSVPQYVSDAVTKAVSLDSSLRQQTCEEFIAEIGGSTAKISERGSVSGSGSDSGLKAYLSVYYGNEKAAVYLLPENKQVIIGRSTQKCSVVVKPEALISREHCSVTWDTANKQLMVCDTSSNGIFLNEAGGYLKHGEPYAFPCGVTLQLASTDIVLKLSIERR